MSDAVKLVADGEIELGNPMPVNVAPQRRDAIEVFSAVQVDQETASRFGDDQRSFGGIGLHGREGMPYVVAVPLFELFTVRWHGVYLKRQLLQLLDADIPITNELLRIITPTVNL